MRRRIWLSTILIAALAGGGWWYASGGVLPWAKTPAALEAATPQRRGPPAPVVRAATARAGDLAITLDGLGTVQAYNSVVVASRVDGQLLRIAFREGQDVKEGDLLAQIDPRTYQAQLDQAIAKRAQDQAQLDNAKRDLERYGALMQQNFASRQQFDTTRAQVAQFEALLKSDDAAIAAARILLSYTNVTAPISGRLGLRLVDAGNIVRANDPAGIVTITQLRPISIVFTLPQQRLAEINARLRAGDRLDVRALRADGTDLDTGRVEFVDNQIDPATGTVKLKAVFPNEALELWPGGFANIRLALGAIQNAILIPAAAVQYGPDGPFAFVVGPGMTAEMRPIRVRQIEGETAAVASGLAAGDRVVLGGQDRLRNGAPITVVGDGEPGPRRGPPPSAAPRPPS
jgi:membrane fusion protein, multidrug efflux system